MRTQKMWVFIVPVFTILLLCFIQINDARGGRRGGSGMFGVWRKSKKTYSSSGSSSSSSRRTQGQKYDIPYTPLKSQTKTSKTQMGSGVNYPRQELPPGASYHASGISFPTGATYHGVAVPPGGVYYANAAAIPPGAIYFAQPPSQLGFSPSNFLLGMYASQIMSHGLLGHHPYVRHIYHDNQQQQMSDIQHPNSEKVVIIENGGPAVEYNPLMANRQGPDDTAVPLAPFNDTSSTHELLQTAEDPAFQRNINDQNPNPGLRGGIICVPHTLDNHSKQPSGGNSDDVQQIPKIICYSATNNDTNQNKSNTSPSTQQQSEPARDIICIPQISLENDPNDPTKTIKVETNVCYPASAVPQNKQNIEEITKSPDSVIGNISNIEEVDTINVATK